MRRAQPPLRRLRAVAVFAPVVASSLGGCDTGFSTEDCASALARCGFFNIPNFCRDSPSACTIGGEPYLDTENIFYIPPNQTVTIDLSHQGLSERAVDLWFHVCGNSQGTIEDFRIQLDGIDVSYDGQGEFYAFYGAQELSNKLTVPAA